MKKVIIISTSFRPDTIHYDFYDGDERNCIPWDTLAEFLNKNL